MAAPRLARTQAEGGAGTRAPHHRTPELERILLDPGESFGWKSHDFPSELARWNYHPECELHLIRASSGMAFVGDWIGPFRPRNLVLVGPNLPHHWESDRAPGEVLRLRDVALQFDPERLLRAAALLPELREIEALLGEARRGLEFGGDAGAWAGAQLERLGRASGLERLVHFLELLRSLARCKHRRPLASVGYVPQLDREASQVVAHIMQYVLDGLTEELRMTEAARRAHMSPAAFSRFFKRHTGHNFVDYVRKLRMGAACKLLSDSSMPVTDICFEVGYRNVSNFNRHFKAEKGVTPSEYRRLSEHRGGIPADGRPGETTVR